MTSRLAARLPSRLSTLLVVVIAGALAGPAHAQPLAPDEHARRLAAAQEARKAAQAAKTREALAACGQAYLAAYNADPLWAHGDELLWTAGWCFEDAGSLGLAIALFERVSTTYPRSMFARRALAHVRWAYADLALFERAADRHEQYAKRYPGEPDAHLGLIDAIRYRAGLGDRDKWIELTSYYVRTFGAQKPHIAVELSYALTDAYAGEVELQIAHLKEHLRRFQLQPDDRIIALTRLGDLRWARACPVPTRDGLCVTKRPQRTSGRCGSATPDLEYEVVKRSDFDRKPALAYYQEAIALARQQGGVGVDQAKQAVARAQLALADDTLERALPAAVPKGLGVASKNPGVRLRQRQAVERWLADRGRAVDKALAAYRDGATPAAPAALYRTARVRELLWHAVTTVRLPANAEAACPIVLDLVGPLRTQTIDAYRACAAKATEVGGQVPDVQMCLRALEVVAPHAHAPQRELVARPAWGSGVLAVEPPLASTPW